MTLTGSGNLGIGTTSPDCALDVQTSGNETKILIQNDTLALLQLRQPTNNYVWNLEIGRTDGEFSMRNGDGEKLRIKANGYVGIGTTSPSTKFTVRSSAAYQGIRLEDSNGNNKINMASSGSGGSGHAYFNLWDSSNTQSVQIHSSPDHDTWFNCKNVGIGTSSPSEKLEVNGKIKATGAIIDETGIGTNTTYHTFLNLQHTSLNGESYAMLQSSTGDTYLNCASGRHIYFRENNVTKMILDSGGNVGIGTDSPSYRLDVNGTARVTGQFDIYGGTRFTHFNFGTNNDAYIRSGESAGKVILQDGDGNVGIGTTSPSYKLDVTGSTRVSNDIYIGWHIKHDGDNSYFGFTDNDTIIFATSNAERVRINSSGNVGIGTSSPSALLHLRQNTIQDLDTTLKSSKYYEI